jgi:hypothetical protein
MNAGLPCFPLKPIHFEMFKFKNPVGVGALKELTFLDRSGHASGVVVTTM